MGVSHPTNISQNLTDVSLKSSRPTPRGNECMKISKQQVGSARVLDPTEVSWRVIAQFRYSPGCLGQCISIFHNIPISEFFGKTPGYLNSLKRILYSPLDDTCIEKYQFYSILTNKYNIYHTNQVDAGETTWILWDTEIIKDLYTWICLNLRWMFTLYQGKLPSNHHLGEYVCFWIIFDTLKTTWRKRSPLPLLIMGI